MNVGKLTKYSFGFWLLYLPLAGVFAWITDVGFIGFSSFVGIGALGLLAFSTLVLLVHIIFGKEKPPMPSKSITAVPTKDNLEGFRDIFAEVQQ